MGKLDHGHAGVPGAGDGDADARPAAAQAVRPDQAPHQSHHDEEHPRTGHLPALHYILASICR